jgi:hypothetical protein
MRVVARIELLPRKAILILLPNRLVREKTTMYKLFHQLDREQKEQENAELFQQEALYNNTCRRDSFSTITTHETELIVQGPNPTSQPVTWGGGDGRLPLEISIPKTQGQLVVVDLNTRDRPEPDRLLEEGDETIPVTLSTSLFVDDDEELNLIFEDENESEAKELDMSAPPLISQSSSGSSDLPIEEDPEEMLRFETERFTRFEV